MSEERRRELASLSFSEKVKILGKLRQRSLILAEARESLAREMKRMALDWSKCDLVESDPLCVADRMVVKGTRLPVESIIADYERGRSITEISQQLDISFETVQALLRYAQQHYALIRPL